MMTPGDQGMVYGYATNESEYYLPLPLVYSNMILEKLTELRHTGEIDWLRPDAKAQVTIEYVFDKPAHITNIVCSQQTRDIPQSVITNTIKDVIYDVLPANMFTENTKLYINPTGRFVIGGPAGDSGLTGRKIVVDTYGGFGHHGGGAFSGKDPSKVDRSAAYYARYVAKNIVAAGIAEKCEIQVSYAIGCSKPLNIYVNTFNNGRIDIKNSDISHFLENTDIFNFTPYGIIDSLKLTTPNGWKYSDICNYGHFYNKDVPWEKLDKVDEIRKYFNV